MLYCISNFQKIKNPNTKAKLSGVHVFCLNSQELERKREKNHRSLFHKPFNELSNTTKIRQAHVFSEQVAVNFNNIAINCFHPDDNPVLQEIHFSIQGKNNFQAIFGAQDIEKENQRNEAFTKVVDQGPI